jgi:hypothetical protein
MSSVTETRKTPDESKVILALVRRKVITDGQLKAAMDYQKSLGGKLLDVLVKLDLVRASQIDEFVRNPALLDAPVQEGEVELSLDPATLDITELKVHRKLLDKIPKEVQERFLLVPFFPRPGGDSRKIIMGHGKDLGPEIAAKLRSILGVDLQTLRLEESFAREVIFPERKGDPAHRRPAADSEPAARPATPAESSGPRNLIHGPEGKSALVLPDNLAGALVNLLIRKGVITKEEIETELVFGASSRARPLNLKT